MPAGSFRFRVGAIWCTVLSDGYFSYPAKWFFPNADGRELARALDHWRLPHDCILSPYTCLLIETGRHVILVDTGAGPYTGTAGAITARLEMYGIRPKDVNTVVLTHAHPDHIGGAVNAAGRPCFPEARHVIAEAEWDFWTSARPDLSSLRVPPEVRDSIAAMSRRCLGPLRFQVEPVDGETEIAPGVRALPAPGHTPGHLAILLSSEGERLLNLADAAVHPLHIQQPEWENGFDLAGSAAVRTRRELLERAVAEKMHLMGFHFPFPSFGRLTALASGGWEWLPGW